MLLFQTVRIIALNFFIIKHMRPIIYEKNRIRLRFGFIRYARHLRYTGMIINKESPKPSRKEHKFATKE